MMWAKADVWGTESDAKAYVSAHKGLVQISVYTHKGQPWCWHRAMCARRASSRLFWQLRPFMPCGRTTILALCGTRLFRGVVLYPPAQEETLGACQQCLGVMRINGYGWYFGVSRDAKCRE